VALNGSTIAAVGQAATAADLPAASQYWDVAGRLIMPGLVNCHCHAAMTLFRGLADDLPLDQWLQQHIFPAEARWVDADFVYTGTLLAAAELIRGGVTTVADAYFCAHGARLALTQAGLRAVVAQGVIDFPAPGVPDPKENLQVAQDFISSGQELADPRIISTLFCHAPYTCSAATLQAAKEVCRRLQLPFFLHVAETQGEVAQCRAQTGLTPVAYLDRLGVLDGQTVAVHGVWLSEADRELLTARQVKVCHCPESNLKLAAGIAPVPDLIRRGLDVGLGSDGAASNNNLDLWGEMASAARLQKVTAQDPTVLPARQVVEMATLAGARVLGLAEHIGSLTPGKEADLIILDLQQPHLTPLYDPYSHLVYAAGAADVVAVMVGGRWLLWERQLLSLDWPEIKHRVAPWAARLRGWHGSRQQQP
ncbi:MAG: amidohydrolase, partial [Desulfobacca sp.]|uniref:amidohydrolase n=1 Tax=Desulfobacca sp. TaxID=2067990 RepID=UPI0040495582